ncbi:insulin-like growth factor 2 mRNA-binding protein 3-A [Macrosteles quadrilineatus]|uniref:insulin-like growth factor 2 mRNA-binding protein 3-A n=1 Tax=Macrosteles quadrilineatus TaxID=74068 RepID=UPI0023E34D05|nr:insulin-like growth factor 2 mRNA-binding protein 3-A [Macrosteles quadrilineatus]XP_054289121.1 insulin-like growth factor 2 mRNA-binding protein 3-A [Macrosteles quadrilineatus]
MSKLYIGNLPADITENTIRQLFSENNLPSKSILIKRGGYAFVDCLDQCTADKAIDLLNGSTFMGAQLVVEPSVAGTTPVLPKNKVQESTEESKSNGN